jgi:hypothetical protein
MKQYLLIVMIAIIFGINTTYAQVIRLGIQTSDISIKESGYCERTNDNVVSKLGFNWELSSTMTSSWLRKNTICEPCR